MRAGSCEQLDTLEGILQQFYVWSLKCCIDCQLEAGSFVDVLCHVLEADYCQELVSTLDVAPECIL